MFNEESLLIVLILLTVYWVVMIMPASDVAAAATAATAVTANAVNAVTGTAATISDSEKVNAVANKAESDSTKENYEYFESQCNIDKQLGSAVDDCSCPANSSFSYANSAYGPSSDYTTWVMNQTIDPTVAANHREFISDRTGESSSVNVMGRTYTPEDSHQSYTPDVTWIGIRGRPSLVPVCSPDQVADVNYGYYPQKQKLNWDSSSTYSV